MSTSIGPENIDQPWLDRGVYPRPLENPLPVWIGVGGTPESFLRAGVLGLPLMVAIIGGETHRFRPLIDLQGGWETSGTSTRAIKGGLTFARIRCRDDSRGSQ